jgi:hypothetical protein
MHFASSFAAALLLRLPLSGLWAPSGIVIVLVDIVEESFSDVLLLELLFGDLDNVLFVDEACCCVVLEACDCDRD